MPLITKKKGAALRAARVIAQTLLVVTVFYQGAWSQALGVKSETRIPKPETRHPTPETPRPISHPNPELVKARWHVLGARPLGLYYYSSGALGLQSLETHASQMTLLGPQCFWVDDQGFVHGEMPAPVVEIARRAKLPVMPLVVNPGFDQPMARALLRNPQAQERAAMYLAYLANRDNYVGWQLDLEHLDPADQERYSRFVARVAARLRRDNRLLSVAVVPRFSDDYPDRSAKEFRTGEWGAPYDYRALGHAADFVTLMTYDHHSESDPPGPVAGYEWVEAAVHYAVARIPRSKLLLGIPFYGREWVLPAAAGPLKFEISNFKSHSLAFQDAQELFARPGIEPRWDNRWRTGWFEYRDASGQHTGWYEDSKSLAAKLQLMRLYQLRGFAAWRLGVEDPKFWTLATPASRPALQNTVRGSERDAKARTPRASKSHDHAPARDGSRSQ